MTESFMQRRIFPSNGSEWQCVFDGKFAGDYCTSTCNSIGLVAPTSLKPTNELANELDAQGISTGHGWNRHQAAQAGGLTRENRLLYIERAVLRTARWTTVETGPLVPIVSQSAIAATSPRRGRSCEAIGLFNQTV